MRGAAQAFPVQPSHPATAMGGELRLDETGIRRETVGRVIDQKDDLCPIDRSHGSSPFIGPFYPFRVLAHGSVACLPAAKLPKVNWRDRLSRPSTTKNSSRREGSVPRQCPACDAAQSSKPGLRTKRSSPSRLPNDVFGADSGLTGFGYQSRKAAVPRRPHFGHCAVFGQMPKAAGSLLYRSSPEWREICKPWHRHSEPPCNPRRPSVL
ncbi:hypothetical protein ABIA14_002737 [Sinorhizobium fredii]